MYEQEARFLGKPVLTVFEVTAYEPGKSVTIESRQSTFPIEVTRRVEPTGDGATRVSATISGDPSGAFKLAAPLMKGMMRRSVQRDYDELKALLES